MAHWIKENFNFQDLQRIMFRLIERVEIFHELAPDDLLRLLEASEKCTFAAGDVILREGSSGAYLYVIIEGEVKVTKQVDNPNGGSPLPRQLATLEAGDSFGEMSLVDQQLRSATVTALRGSVLLRLSEQSCWKDPATSGRIYRNIARVLSRRLRDMDDAFVLNRTRR